MSGEQADSPALGEVLLPGRCCILLPLGLGVKLIGFAELIVSAGFLLFFSLSEEYSLGGSKADSGEVLYITYTAIIDGILAIYLLVGVYKEKRHYAKLWSGAQAVHFVGSILVAGYRILFSSTENVPSVEHLASFLLSTGLDAYFILVAYSYYRQGRPRHHQDQPTIPMAV